MTRLRHYDDLGTSRFVTFSCYRFAPSLRESQACELLAKNLSDARKKHEFKLLGYVFMPDHVHLVLWPPDDMKLGLVIREIKSKMAREFFAALALQIPGPRVFWERRCYDHNCRSVETTKEKINYCHNNPVRRGLVTEPGEYVWSSYNWYQGKRDVPLEIDEVLLM